MTIDDLGDRIDDGGVELNTRMAVQLCERFGRVRPFRYERSVTIAL